MPGAATNSVAGPLGRGRRPSKSRAGLFIALAMLALTGRGGAAILILEPGRSTTVATVALQRLRIRELGRAAAAAPLCDAEQRGRS